MIGCRCWGSGLAALAAALVVAGCISKGDTNIEGGGGRDVEGGSLCAQYCAKIEDQGCNLNPNCESNCAQNVQRCLDAGDSAADIFLECAIAEPITCGSTGDPYNPTCSDEYAAAAECMAGGGACVAAGESCDDEGDCCDGTTCVNFPELGGAHCTADCESDDDCASECCVALESGGAACAPAEYCLEPGTALIGDACTTDEDCESLYCEFLSETGAGYCSLECTTSSECGISSAGIAATCWVGTCGPGCSTDEDCAPFGAGDWFCFPDTELGESYCVPGE